jgi:hypothetical protein
LVGASRHTSRGVAIRRSLPDVTTRRRGHSSRTLFASLTSVRI